MDLADLDAIVRIRLRDSLRHKQQCRRAAARARDQAIAAVSGIAEYLAAMVEVCVTRGWWRTCSAGAIVPPMRRLVVFAACGLLAACGYAEQSRVARTREPPLRLVKAPLVVADRWGVIVWVRVNRPLHDNEGLLSEHHDLPAHVEIPGTRPDIPGLRRDDLHPTCYGQSLGGEIANGEAVDVALVLSPSQRITATVPAHVWKAPGNIDARALRRLRCPTDRATRRCRGTVQARHLLGIGAQSATNASCRVLRAVMRSVGRWADSRRCYETLCVGKHRINRGYRCSVDLVGEAAWQITCVRGRRIVRGSTAE